MSWHQTIIVGNLGGDPELRYMQNGRAVCNFSVAVSERWRDRQTNEQQERTTWYRVAVWGPQAENCNTYLAKGRRVLVTGNVSARGYINNNGEAAASLDLNARDVRFLSSRGEDDQQGGGWQGGGRQGGGRREGQRRDDRASNYADPPSSVDDIPF
ncbi:MAG: single-stranded DNA-binding protein [Chloroflexi bacterium]|nr:single-stranded DNA-binding protein [Chloroflexota bacterium]